MHRESATYAISNIASLITVCSVALADSSTWGDKVRETITQDIVHVLELAAILAEDAAVLAERETAKASKTEAGR
jgi:hypothetical protein